MWSGKEVFCRKIDFDMWPMFVYNFFLEQFFALSFNWITVYLWNQKFNFDEVFNNIDLLKLLINEKWNWQMSHTVCINQGNSKGESVVVTILPSSYCTSEFFRRQAILLSVCYLSRMDLNHAGLMVIAR